MAQFEYDIAGICGGASDGNVKLLLDRQDKPLGVQILGPQAGELLSAQLFSENVRKKLKLLFGYREKIPGGE